jgi:hypothetical protein
MELDILGGNRFYCKSGRVDRQMSLCRRKLNDFQLMDYMLNDLM